MCPKGENRGKWTEEGEKGKARRGKRRREEVGGRREEGGGRREEEGGRRKEEGGREKAGEIVLPSFSNSRKIWIKNFSFPLTHRNFSDFPKISRSSRTLTPKFFRSPESKEYCLHNKMEEGEEERTQEGRRTEG